jgi:hypothetical protein
MLLAKETKKPLSKNAKKFLQALCHSSSIQEKTWKNLEYLRTLMWIIAR